MKRNSVRRNGNEPLNSRRPHTTPNPLTLTPHFHWNLNTSAIQSLADGQVNQLYRCFRFYDSSTIGDSLPAINSTRFLQLLRDANLVSDQPGQELQVTTVEKVFAEAVLGKLRTYLDAEGQPALTFQLFCGALLNCARIKYPRDDQPMKRIFQDVILTFSSPTILDPVAEAGLLQHISSATNQWNPSNIRNLHGVIDDEEPTDYRQREAFRNVIAGFYQDDYREAQKAETLQRAYTPPTDMIGHFPPQALDFIVARFKMFDVFDRGLLLREEIYPFLSGLIKHVDVTDIYEVLAVLMGTDPKTGTKTIGVTLEQVLKALHACRRATTAPVQKNVASRRVAAAAKTAVTLGAVPSPGKRNPNNGDEEHDDDELTSLQQSPKGRKTLTKLKRERSVSVLGKHATKGTATHHNGLKTQSKRSGQKKRESDHGHHPPTHHRGRHEHDNDEHNDDDDAKSTLASEHDDHSSGASHVPRHPMAMRYLQRQESMRSGKSNLSSSATLPSTPYSPSTPGNDDMDNNDLLSDRERLETRGSTAKPYQDTSVMIFLRLGGDHDGAMFCEIRVQLRSREVMEITGTYYQNGEREITEVRQFPPQRTKESALLLTKKCLDARKSEGYSVLGGLDDFISLCAQVEDSHPRYAMPLQSRQSRRLSSRAAEPDILTLDGPRAESPNASQPGELVRQASTTALATNELVKKLGGIEGRSLERAGTFVRQPSASDLIAYVSDSLLHKHLKMKKRQTLRLVQDDQVPIGQLHPERAASPLGSRSPHHHHHQQQHHHPTNHFTQLFTSPSMASLPPNYEQLLDKWELTSADDTSWINAFNTSPATHMRPRQLVPLHSPNH